MLAHLEAHFVDILLQLAAMRQPVNKSTALNLINSLVETAQLQDYIIEWKKKHLLRNKLVSSNSNAGEEHGAYLGDKYWQNFLSRHEELKTKTAVRFDSNREDWCSYMIIEFMYDQVYSAMVKSGVALQLPEKVWLDKEGRIMQEESAAVGRQTQYVLTRLNMVFFVEEVGDNTSHKNDGNVAGEKFVMAAEQRALI